MTRGTPPLQNHASPFCYHVTVFQGTGDIHDAVASFTVGQLVTNHHSAAFPRKEVGQWAQVQIPSGANLDPRDPVKGAAYVHSILVWNQDGQQRLCKPQTWVTRGGAAQQ